MVEANRAWRQALRTFSDVLTGTPEAPDRCAVTDRILAQTLAERGYPNLSLSRFRRNLSGRTLSSMPWAGEVVGRTQQQISARLTRNRQHLMAVLPAVDAEKLTSIVNAFCYKPYLNEVHGYDVPTTVELETMELVIPTLGRDAFVSETGRAIGQVAKKLYDTDYIKVMRRNGRGFIYLADTFAPLLI